MFPIVMIAGAIGGVISLQRRLKQLTDDDRQLLVESWLYVCLAPFAGGVLAGVLYLIFLSGLLAGQLFPKFEFDPSADNIVGLPRLFHMYSTQPAEYAKL